MHNVALLTGVSNRVLSARGRTWKHVSCTLPTFPPWRGVPVTGCHTVSHLCLVSSIYIVPQPLHVFSIRHYLRLSPLFLGFPLRAKVYTFPVENQMAEPFMAETHMAESHTAEDQTAEHQMAEPFTVETHTAESHTAEHQTAEPFTAETHTVESHTVEHQTAEPFTAETYTTASKSLQCQAEQYLFNGALYLHFCHLFIHVSFFFRH